MSLSPPKRKSARTSSSSSSSSELESSSSSLKKQPSEEDVTSTRKLSSRQLQQPTGVATSFVDDQLVLSDAEDDDTESSGLLPGGPDGDGEDKVIVFPRGGDLASGDDDVNEAARVVQLGNFQDMYDESDSSDDEGTINRIGDVPLEWYKDEEHLGYDVEGKKLMKKERSALQELLDTTDDRDAYRTIYDALHDEKKVLSNAELEMIFNLQRNRTLGSGYDMYADYPEGQVSFDPLNHPLARPSGPSKKKFVPKRHEMRAIEKMVKRLMEKKDEDVAAEKKKKQEEEQKEDKVYALWDDAGKPEMDNVTRFKYYNRVPKPRAPPPGTYESYRPPPEYVPSEKTKAKYQALRAIDRKEHFLPEQFSTLRHVPFYHHSIQDSYQRCLDLAFFPRRQRSRLVVDPSKLLPELPDPKDLRPYPDRLSFHYKGHTSCVRSVSLNPNGEYLATGCDDHMVRIYEVQTGRLMKRYDMAAPIQQVKFNPNPALNLLAVAADYTIAFIVPTFAAHTAVNEHTIRSLRIAGGTGGSATSGSSDVAAGVASVGSGGITQGTIDADETVYQPAADLDDVEERDKRADFVDALPAERAAGIIVKVSLHARVKRMTFHAKGDYMCALCPKDHVKYRQTIMLQLSKRKVFCPFRKFAEVVTDCCFHPREPFFFLSTTNSVRCYNLLAHKMQKRYKAPGGLTTCLSVHPDGDNFLVGDSTSHTVWYDCDFSDKPYKRMRSHKGVVNSVAYHRNTDAYPLFASGASDGQVHVFHGMVYDDYSKNATIVPVKILRHSRPVYDVCWHPTLPWIFTSTEDGTVSCWTE